jgi:hypothetical protein
MSFSSLSIKQLNHLIRATAASSSLTPSLAHSLLQQRERVSEKSELVELCQQHVPPERVQELLAAPLPHSPTATATATATTSEGVSDGGSGGVSEAGSERVSEGVAQMSPEQLQRQVRAMRANPSAFTHMQSPALSEEQVLQAGEPPHSLTH